MGRGTFNICIGECILIDEIGNLQFLPVAYAVGLGFLPKQYRQEYSKVQTNDDEEDRN